MNIYTKFGKQDTIYKFIQKLYSDISRGSEAHALPTYKDEGCFELQCLGGKYRSFDDLFDCVRTYYPHVTPEYLMHILLTVNIKSDKRPLYLFMSNCSGIDRIRIYYYYEEKYTKIDCYKYNSKWSWIELLAMLGLNTINDIKKYVNYYKNETLQNT